MMLLAVLLLAYVTAWFLLALARRDNSLADVAWGGGFVLLAVGALVLRGEVYPRSLLATILVTAWGVRLALHVAARNRGRGEDFRYAAWRQQWGSSWVWRSYLQVFLLQGVLLYLVAVAVMRINLATPPGLTWLDLVGALIWLNGFLWETVADWQLLRHTRNPATAGTLLDRGLWRYSRHPNYFGEALQWWGIWLLALSVPGEWWTVASPLAITLLLLFVSGVPMLERSLAERVPGYRDYQQRTSIFFPAPPRR
jgi:steroid 5-alpha reductase family enzyme